MKKQIGSLFSVALMIATLALSAPASAEFEIKQWSIASGGILNSSGGDWTLSGTIGQWEATEARALSGGGWQLTGGFWGMSLEELADFLFRDRFEGQNPFSAPDQSTATASDS
ncbi:MAG: hypothetical protein EA370_10645 [Wenzhouxiangella sp.]|nr:MAG: hypothetical protein EA370_10645 [Wenzhouxiangella sp.]